MWVMSRSLFQKIKDFPELKLALGFGWALGLTVAPSTGFYMGTIIGSKHVQDMQSQDISNGFLGAGIGLIVGLLFATTLTMVYPSLVEKEYEERAQNSS